MNDIPRSGFWGQFWDRVSAQVDAPSLDVLTAGAVLCVAIMLIATRFGHFSIANPARWPKFLVTQTHEGAHAVAAVVCRHGLTAIRLEADHSGVTKTIDYGGFGSFLVSFSGYLGPGLVAVGMGALLGDGYPYAALTAYAAFSVAMLLFMRNALGFTFVAAVAAITGVVVYYGNDSLAMFLSIVLCWYLAVGGIAGAMEQIRVVRHQPDAGADAQALRWMTHLPALLWAAIHLLLAAMLAGVGVMLSLSV